MRLFRLLALIILLGSCNSANSNGYKNVTSDNFEKFIKENCAQILDVRTEKEYKEGHIPGSILIDVNSPDFRNQAIEELSKETPVAVYCRSGKRSLTACDILSKEGFNVINLENGFIGWQESGKDVSTKDIYSVYDFIKKCGYYFIATVEKDQPRVRPFGTVNIFEGRLYIQTSHMKRIASQIKKNSKVELCAYDGEQWIRLSGTLVEDSRIEAKKSMLDAYPNLRSMYNEKDEKTAVYYFTHATAYLSSFKNPEETIRF